MEDLERRDKSFAKTLSLMVENVVKGRKDNTELPKPDPMAPILEGVASGLGPFSGSYVALNEKTFGQ